jgi:hypothetical protein
MLRKKITTKISDNVGLQVTLATCVRQQSSFTQKNSYPASHSHIQSLQQQRSGWDLLKTCIPGLHWFSSPMAGVPVVQHAHFLHASYAGVFLTCISLSESDAEQASLQYILKRRQLWAWPYTSNYGG